MGIRPELIPAKSIYIDCLGVACGWLTEEKELEMCR